MVPDGGARWVIPVHGAVSRVSVFHRPPAITGFADWLRGISPEWALEADARGLGLRGARERWTWADVRAVRLRGGAYPSSVVLEGPGLHLELIGRMLPVRALEGWSVARLHRAAMDLARWAGVPLDDRSDPAGALVARAVADLRTRATASRDAHRTWFVRDPRPLLPHWDEVEGETRLELVWATVAFTAHHLRVGRTRTPLAEVDAVDLVVESDHGDLPGDRVVWARIVGVVRGRPEVLTQVRVTDGGVLQAGWAAEQLDRAARAVPFEEMEVPGTLRALLPDG